MSRLLIKTAVTSVEQVAENIRALTLVHAKGRQFPSFSAGAHVDVVIPDLGRRQYSICSSPQVRTHLRIAVLNEPNGRGGSRWINESVCVGDNLVIGSPRNTFPLVADAKEHIFIAGGIGITPMMAMIQEAQILGDDFHLHYCTRTPEKTAFLDDLEDLRSNGMATVYFDNGDPAQGCDISALLRDVRTDAHIYCCGPTGLVAAVKQASEHWPGENVHIEQFVGTDPVPMDFSDPFTIELLDSGKTIEVGADETALAAISRADIVIPSGCESGACGACIVSYSGGTPIHRDVCLTDEERQSSLTVCVSRAKGRLLINL